MSIKNIKGIENIDKSFPGLSKEIDKLIESAKNGFTQGYTCAVANLVRMTGDPTGTTECELLACSVSNVKELIKSKCDPDDIKILRQTIKELERKRLLSPASHQPIKLKG